MLICEPQFEALKLSQSILSLATSGSKTGECFCGIAHKTLATYRRELPTSGYYLKFNQKHFSAPISLFCCRGAMGCASDANGI